MTNILALMFRTAAKSEDKPKKEVKSNLAIKEVIAKAAGLRCDDNIKTYINVICSQRSENHLLL